MMLLLEPELGDEFPCPYLQGRVAQYLAFYAQKVDPDEMDLLLEKGWRKFGLYFFRPACPSCRECIPIRIPVNSFRPSKSQRRSVRKNADLIVEHDVPVWSDPVFEVYRDHSQFRFDRSVSRIDLEESLLTSACRSLQTRYYDGKELLAVGFLDHSQQALSSVYFVYRQSSIGRGIGIFSIVREVALTAGLGLAYYYLGYYVAHNHHMAYKGSFAPCETMDWETGEWKLHSTRLN